ncbi:protein sidekick-like [Musca domestica]|uniref:Protein sidekick-like n=2 Tax=Musca domestica TaxID=7370 RepID=A0A9J7I856_MUSDO|nr:protein sidekick-like [Musca domestica]
MIETMKAANSRIINFGGICLLLLSIMSEQCNADVTVSFNAIQMYDETTYRTTLPTYTPPPWIEPYVDPTTPRNVTALMGKTAYLNCRVINLGNKTVSWIRHRDSHILTVGTYTYTSDLRFQALHFSDIGDWTLQIKWVQKRDAGTYECQISTQPARSYFIHLNIVVPTASIYGGPDLYVDKGSTINLTCTVKFCLEPPAYVFWYHHEELINYDSTRGGVSVVTEKGDITTSYLLLQNADLADSGKYSCAPSNAEMTSIRVHVLSGEHPEAMQTGSSGNQHSWLTIIILITHILFCKQHSMSCIKTAKQRNDAHPTMAKQQIYQRSTTATTATTATELTEGFKTAELLNYPPGCCVLHRERILC